MNKNKGIWLVIVSILIIGMAVTFATSRFIRRNGGSLDTTAVTQMTGTTAGGAALPPFQEGAATEAPAAAKGRASRTAPSPMKEKAAKITEEAPAVSREASEAAEAAAPEMMLAAEGGAAAVPDSAMVEDSAAAVEEAAPAAAEAGPGNKADAAVVPSISPLGPVGSTSGTGSGEKLAYYEKRLADLDSQVQKMRSESSDSTTYSMKTMAEKELKLWNIEMNTIYAEIMEELGDDEKDKLESDQQTWMKTRDTKAEEAARKYSGGSLEGVEYTASQAASTRNRTYDLVEGYIDALPAENEE